MNFQWIYPYCVDVHAVRMEIAKADQQERLFVSTEQQSDYTAMIMPGAVPVWSGVLKDEH